MAGHKSPLIKTAEKQTITEITKPAYQDPAFANGVFHQQDDLSPFQKIEGLHTVVAGRDTQGVTAILKGFRDLRSQNQDISNMMPDLSLRVRRMQLILGEEGIKQLRQDITTVNSWAGSSKHPELKLNENEALMFLCGGFQEVVKAKPNTPAPMELKRKTK